MARGGFNLSDVAEASRRIRELVAEGVCELQGLWSHLARADEVECGLTEIQVGRFEQARSLVKAAGLAPVLCHPTAASAGALWHPAAL